MAKLTNDLIRIFAAGGGVEIDGATKLTDDIIRIAAASKNKGAKVIVKNSGSKLTEDLIRIAAVGGGNVTFYDL